MRKVVFLLSVILIAFAGPALTLTSAKASGFTPADASSLALACNVQPNSNDNFTADWCSTDNATTAYSITYQVQGGTGTYNYAWTPPAHSTVVQGCTSTSDICAISVRHGAGDQDFVATVVLVQNGKTLLSADAYLAAVCPGSEGYVFC